MFKQREKEFYYIFLRDRTCGIGSEVNNLILAIYHAVLNNYSFKLLSKQWVGTDGKGWSKFFTSLKNERDEQHSNTIEFKWINFYYSLSKLKLSQYFEENIIYKNHSCRESKNFKLIIKNHSHWADKKNLEKPFILGINKIAKRIWKLKPAILEQVEEKVATYRLGEYICIHIRRGDKLNKEDKKYEAEEYMEVVKKIHTKIKTIFIMTDDHSTYEELVAKYPEYNFITLSNESRKGFNEHRFYQKNEEEMVEENNNFLVELEIARRSSYFIGTYRSNVFVLIKYLKVDNCYELVK